MTTLFGLKPETARLIVMRAPLHNLSFTFLTLTVLLSGIITAPAQYKVVPLATKGTVLKDGSVVGAIDSAVSVNRSGMMAFTGTLTANGATGSALAVTDGEISRRIGFANFGGGRTYSWPQINDAGKVIARDRVTTESLIRTWDSAKPGTFETLVSTVTSFSPEFGSVTLPTLANDGGSGFVGVPDSGDTAFYCNPFAVRDDVEHLVDLDGGGIRPMAADGGRFVLRDGAGTSGPVIFMQRGALRDTEEIIADTGVEQPWDATGAAPGISSDGKIIAFAATLSGAGAAAINAAQSDVLPLQGTTGIYLAMLRKDAKPLYLQVAGISGNDRYEAGETFTDTNQNGVFDPGEADTGEITAIDFDNRVAVERMEGNIESQYQICFTGKNSTGHQTVFSKRINTTFLTRSGYPYYFHEPVLKVVSAGDQIEGLGSPVASLQLYDPLSATGVVAVHAVLDDNDKSTAILKATPLPGKVLVVATHGFGNNLPIVFPDFLENWFRMKPVYRGIPRPGSLLDGKVDVYISQWDSSAGWVEAAKHLFAGVIWTAKGNPISAALAFAQIEAEMQRAHRIAVAAAHRIFNDLRFSGKLASSEETRNDQQIVELVGHSRGGAVSALLARLLSDAGYRVHLLTLLDGYSTDWPNQSGLLGDIDIAAEVSRSSGLLGKINYRVEEDLGAIMPHRLAPYLPESLIPLASSSLNWRAPEREGFHNKVIAGAGLTEGGAYTNHINITQAFLASAGRPDYLTEDYVGFYAEAPKDSAAPFPPLSELVSGYSPLSVRMPKNGGFGSSDNGVSDELLDFPDGGFEEMAGRSRARKSAVYPATNDPGLQEWIDLMKDPTSLLKSAMDVTGKVTLIDDPGGAALRLACTTQSDPAAAFDILLSALIKDLQFDTAIESPGVGDALEVLLDTEVLRSIPLASLSQGYSRLSIPLPSGGLREVRITFRLKSGPAGGHNGTVRLDNLSLNRSPGPAPALLSKVTISDNGSINFSFTAPQIGNHFVEQSIDLTGWDTVKTYLDFQGAAEVTLPPVPGAKRVFIRVRSVFPQPQLR